MSDRPIQKGDLVMIVRGHSCVLNKLGGIPFVVTGFMNPRGGGWRCSRCLTMSAGPNELGVTGDIGLRGGAAPVSWLLRIDPSNLSEDIPEKEELHA